MHSPTQRAIESILWTIAPGRCLLCDLASHRRLDLCRDCERELPGLGPACFHCALPLNPRGSGNGLLDASGNSLCGACFAHPPKFARAVCPWRFDREIAAWLGSIKHGRATAPARVLGELFAQHVLRARLDTPLPDALVPVPLSRRRQVLRGHNQAETLARRLAPKLGRPVFNALRRKRHTASQQGLSRAERLNNVAGAFVAAADVQDQHLALVDDVMTTGSTLRQACTVLLRAGAGSVEVWPMARAVTGSVTGRGGGL